MVVYNNILAGAAGSGGAGYKIERSLRFNSGDSAYLSRDFSAGNRKTWTWSGWIKKTADAGSPDDALFTAGTAGATQNRFIIKFSTGDQSLEIGQDVGGSFTLFRKTSQVFRDYSSWGHLVVAFDSTNSTANDRLKIYWNGSQITQFATNNTITQNLDTFVNNTGAHYICDDVGNYHGNLDAFLAEVNFLDGITPGTNTDDVDGSVTGTPNAEYLTDFGEFDDNGVWQPKEYTGIYNDPGNNPVADSVLTGTIYSGAGTIANLFDGTDTGVGPSDGSYITYTPSTPIPINSTLRVKGNVSNASVDANFKINGTAVSTVSEGFPAAGGIAGASTTWTTISNPPSSLTSLEFGWSGSWMSVSGIEIDGVVISTIAAGQNGFHLDFSDNSSNAALGYDAAGSNNWTVNNLNSTAGRIYTSEGSISGTFYDSAGGAASKMFDGSASTGAFSQTGTATFTFGGSTITASSSLQIRAFKGDSSGANVLVNGTDISSLLNAQSGGGYSTVNITSTLGGAPINLSNVSVVNAGGGSGNIAQIFVDGVELIDGSFSDNDSLIDTPTDYEASSGNNGGNYCTLNPLQNSGVTLSNGNLDVTGGGNWYGAAGTFGMSSGKWYFEYDNVVGNEHLLGIVPASTYTLSTASSYAYGSETGGKYSPSAGNVSYGDSWTTGDVIGVAFDADNGDLYFYKNGTIQNSGTAAFTGLTSGPYLPSAVLNGSSRSASLNFGQRPFAYTPPTGFLSLCTTNLPDPTIADGSTAFDAKLWSGNSAQDRKISTQFSPDFVWVKRRSGAKDHILVDKVRGDDNYLISNSTAAEAYLSGALGLVSDGFELGTTQSLNETGSTYVGWAWDAGTSNTSISAGSLNSSVYDQSQTWSGGTTSGSATLSGNGFDKMFNGQYGSAGQTQSSGNAILTFTSPISFNKDTGDTLELIYWQTFYVYTSAGTVTLSGGNSATNSFRDVTSNLPSGSITITGIGVNVARGMRINGKPLIDSGVSVTNVPTIASTVRANPSAGFSIVSYTGNGTSPSTIGHGLNAAVEMIWLKNRDSAQNWAVYHKGLIDGSTVRYLRLNTTDAQVTGSGHWKNTAATSSVFSVGNDPQVNDSGDDYVAYCFAPVEGYSAFGKYTGNGSADGPFVALSFRPAFLIIKRTDSTGSWVTYDTQRNPYNTMDLQLLANKSFAETLTTTGVVDTVSNGFKIRGTGSNTNASGGSFIYIAFAENPFKTARAR